MPEKKPKFKVPSYITPRVIALANALEKDQDVLAWALKDIRAILGWTTVQMGAALGVTSTLEWEKGIRCASKLIPPQFIYQIICWEIQGVNGEMIDQMIDAINNALPTEAQIEARQRVIKATEKRLNGLLEATLEKGARRTKEAEQQGRKTLGRTSGQHGLPVAKVRIPSAMERSKQEKKIVDTLVGAGFSKKKIIEMASKALDKDNKARQAGTPIRGVKGIIKDLTKVMNLHGQGMKKDLAEEVVEETNAMSAEPKLKRGQALKNVLSAEARMNGAKKGVRTAEKKSQPKPIIRSKGPAGSKNIPGLDKPTAAPAKSDSPVVMF